MKEALQRYQQTSPCTALTPGWLRMFSAHCRQKYGMSVSKIALDAGFLCPNRQHGGCLFCHPRSFAPGYLASSDPLPVQLQKGKDRIVQSGKAFFAYFQQESITAIPMATLLPLLSACLTDADCRGLILSTRPDCLKAPVIAALGSLVVASGKECLIEIGVQSVHQRSLTFLNRRHSYADFTGAVRRLQDAGAFTIGAHLLFGIPGENTAAMLESVQSVCALGIEAIKFHHLQIVRDTPLAQIYQQEPFPLFSPQSYLELLLQIIPLLPDSLVIHRLWATCHPSLLLAPRWGMLAAALSEQLRQAMVARGLYQGQLAGGIS